MKLKKEKKKVKKNRINDESKETREYKFIVKKKELIQIQLQIQKRIASQSQNKTESRKDKIKNEEGRIRKEKRIPGKEEEEYYKGKWIKIKKK